jgi:hypothetical protein
MKCISFEKPKSKNIGETYGGGGLLKMNLTEIRYRGAEFIHLVITAIYQQMHIICQSTF